MYYLFIKEFLSLSMNFKKDVSMLGDDHWIPPHGVLPHSPSGKHHWLIIDFWNRIKVLLKDFMIFDT